MPFVVGPFALCCISFAVMLGLQGDLTSNVGGPYFAIVLACMGIYPSAPALIAWVGNNQAPASRRAVSTAFNICIGNAGGIMGSYLFFDSEAPVYSTGFGLSLAFALSGLLTAVVAEGAYKVSNRRRDRIPEAETRARHTQDQLVAMGTCLKYLTANMKYADMASGPNSPLFRYTL